MGQINERKLNDGTPSFTALVRRKKGGVTVFKMPETFPTRKAAETWAKKVKEKLKAGFIQRRHDRFSLADVTDRYIEEAGPKLGKTKRQRLTALKAHDIATRRCIDITCDSPGGLVVLGKRLAIKRAVANVIDNALTYGLDARVFTRRRDGHAVVVVEDSGPASSRRNSTTVDALSPGR